MFRYLLKCGADELIQDKVELVFIYPKGIKSLPQTLFFNLRNLIFDISNLDYLI